MFYEQALLDLAPRDRPETLYVQPVQFSLTDLVLGSEVGAHAHELVVVLP